MTTYLEAVTMLAAGLFGTGVVLTRDPPIQAIVAGAFGLCLMVLFLLLQAPDVSLSEIVVGAAAFPTMIMLAVAKVRLAERRDQDE